MKISKAIIPIAGRGTRFLPATKAVAKELIPIINVPMVYYVVQEAVQAGMDQVIFITSDEKEAVLNFFDQDLALELFLKSAGKEKELEMVRKLSQQIEIISIRQKQALGLGHAILQASPLIASHENFAVLLADDLVVSQGQPAIAQLAHESQQLADAPVIGIMEVASSEIHRYGIIEGKSINPKTYQVQRMLEKPALDETDSCLACPGRYILPAEIMEILKQTPKGAGGEYQLTDAIDVMSKKKKTYAHLFEGERFDTGNIHGYLDAVIAFSLREPDLKKTLLQSIEKRIPDLGAKK